MGKTFQKMYANAVRAKAIKQLTPTYQQWDKEGKCIVGIFIGVTSVTSRLGGPEYNQYLFDTDDGRVKFALGRSADGEVGGTLTPGILYAITYRGKDKIAGGRTVNRFNVEEIGIADDLPEDEDEDGEEEVKAKGKKKAPLELQVERGDIDGQ